jgi:3-oxoacyl-[acyl-carrier protein] reductase
MRTYLVFGATGGIGSALCRVLSAGGGRVHVSGRDAGRLAVLGSEMGTAPLVADATVMEEVEGVYAELGRSGVELDGVACYVGSMLLQPAHRTSLEEWRGTMAANLDAAFFVLRGAAQAMGRRGGSIVLTSSAAARIGLANHEAIAAAKAGVTGLALAAAATYASRGIRVNCVAPGLTRTPLTAKLTGSEAALQASTAMHPLGRIGEPEDVARAMAWLLGPESAWVTGQTMGVDGGLADLKTRTV